MKRLIKIIGIGTAVLIGVLFLVVTFLDLNSFRKPIVTAISEATGLGIEINGLSLDPTKGLGVKAEGLKVSDSNSTLFSADALFLEARLLPLLSGRFEVDDVSVVRPRLDLFLDTGKPQPPSNGESPVGSHVEKSKNDVPERIRELFRNLKVDVGNIHIEEGQFAFVPGAGLNPVPLVASFDLLMDRAGAEHYKISLTNLALHANAMTLTGQVLVPNVLDKAGVVDVDLSFAPFALSVLRGWFPLLPEDIRESLEQLALSGNARQLDLLASLPIASLGDTAGMIQKTRARLTTELFKVTLNLNGKNWQVDQWKEQLNWADGKLGLEGGGQVLGGSLQLNGNLSPALDPSGQEGFLGDLSLSATAIQFDRWATDEAWMPVAGALTGKAKIIGPLSQPELLKVNADFSADNLVLNASSDFPNLPIGFPQLKGNIKMQGDQMRHRIEGVFMDAPFTLVGMLSKNAELGPNARHLNTEINVSQIAFSALQPWFPEGWSEGQGQLSANIKITGPVSNAKNLRVATEIQSGELSVRSPEFLGSTPITFSRFKARATLAKGQLYQDIDSSLLGGHLTWKGKLTLPDDGAAPVLSGHGQIGPMGLESIIPFINATSNTPWKPLSGQLKAAIHLEGPIKPSQTLKVRTNLTGENWKVQAPKENGGQVVSLPSWNFNGRWANGVLKHNLKADAFQGKINMEGDLKVPTGNGSVEVDSKIHLENIAFKSIAPFIDHPWSPREGTLSGDVQLNGPLDIIPEWRLKGRFKAGGLVLKPEDKIHTIALASITAQAPAGKPSLIDFSLDRVTTGNIPLKQVKGQLALAENEVRVNKMKVFPTHGTLDIQGAYKPDSKKYHFDFSGTGLRAEDFYKKYVDGAVQLSGTVKGHVPEKGPATQGLSGNLKLLAKEGNIQKMETLKAILVVLNPISVLKLNRRGYPYKSLGGNILMERGTASTSNLKLISDDMRLFVEGQTSLPNQTLNLSGEFIPAEGLNKAVKAVPLLGQVITGGKQGGLIETPFKVKGTWSEPKVSIGGGGVKGAVGKGKGLLKELGKQLQR